MSTQGRRPCRAGFCCSRSFPSDRHSRDRCISGQNGLPEACGPAEDEGCGLRNLPELIWKEAIPHSAMSHAGLAGARKDVGFPRPSRPPSPLRVRFPLTTNLTILLPCPSISTILGLHSGGDAPQGARSCTPRVRTAAAPAGSQLSDGLGVRGRARSSYFH